MTDPSTSQPMYNVRIINGPHFRVNPTDKDNPSPDVLPPDARQLWDQTQTVANDYYKGAWDLADMTAWRAVKMRYPDGAGDWRPKAKNPTQPPAKPMKVPNPEELIVLGVVLEYVVIEDPPRLDVYRFHGDQAPLLMWSPEGRMLMILPQDNIPDQLDPDLSQVDIGTSQLYRDYHWGQSARGFVRHQVPASSVKPIGMADTVVYRSSKGTGVRDDPPGSQEYIHQYGDSVVAYQGPSLKDPKAIVFQGGDLKVEGPGIIN